MSEPLTETGRKVVAIYGSRLLDDVIGIEIEARKSILDAARDRPGLDAETVMDVIVDAFDAEKATRQGNGWSDVHGPGFVITRVRAALDPTAAGEGR